MRILQIQTPRIYGRKVVFFENQFKVDINNGNYGMLTIIPKLITPDHNEEMTHLSNYEEMKIWYLILIKIV